MLDSIRIIVPGNSKLVGIGQSWLYRAYAQSQIDSLAEEYNLYEGRSCTLDNLKAIANIHYKINALMCKTENLIYPKLHGYACNERFKLCINNEPRKEYKF
jgi:hypothetical protein